MLVAVNARACEPFVWYGVLATLAFRLFDSFCALDDRDVTFLHSYRFRGGEAYIGHDGPGRRACDPLTPGGWGERDVRSWHERAGQYREVEIAAG
jgi:hypothetical protein